MNRRFAIIGAAGYIAPRHLKAIESCGGEILAAYDPFDSVGHLDQYSRKIEYYKTMEAFYSFLKHPRAQSNAGSNDESGAAVDYVSICSPNHFHRDHIALALDCGAHAICEKPLVLTTAHCDTLQELESLSGKKVFTILQLRCHPKVLALKEKVAAATETDCFDVELDYITSRGPWYHQTWKTHPEQSGGLAANIGIHFFDMLLWIFGEVKDFDLQCAEKQTMEGTLKLSRANVSWRLSIDDSNLPPQCVENNQSTFRCLRIAGEEFEFSGGFTDLHTQVYQNILAGNGFGIEQARPAIALTEKIREAALHIKPISN